MRFLNSRKTVSHLKAEKDGIGPTRNIVDSQLKTSLHLKSKEVVTRKEWNRECDITRCKVGEPARPPAARL